MTLFWGVDVEDKEVSKQGTGAALACLWTDLDKEQRHYVIEYICRFVLEIGELFLKLGLFYNKRK